MGDLRNKFRKQAQQAATEAMQRRNRPPTPAEPPIRCQCGKTVNETIIWAVAQGLRQPSKFYCLTCYPGGDPHFLCACGARPTWAEHHPDGGPPTLYCEPCRIRAGLTV